MMQQEHNRLTTKRKICDNPLPLGTRRSQQNVERKDYKAMHTGSGQLLSTGTTIVSEHMAREDQKEGYIEIRTCSQEVGEIWDDGKVPKK